MQKSRLFALIAAGAFAALSLSVTAAPKKDFNVCWTIYAGWMPWEYAGTQGIIDKWAKKYDIHIKVTQLNDYVESINQYTAGQFDGCTMTNMDALTIPAAGGVESTALVVSDFSNGNDGIVIKGAGKKVADLKGMDVNLVELSVSHYLLARALDSVAPSQWGHSRVGATSIPATPWPRSTARTEESRGSAAQPMFEIASFTAPS